VSCDIFEFWSEISPSETIHPRDKVVLERADHNFDLRCLPACFDGPLRTARVVLLYLSPGWSESDIEDAASPIGQNRYAERRKGYAPLTGRDEHEGGWRWLASRTRSFGEWEQLRHNLAILNISPYHSKEFSDHSLLAALPSCRTTLNWAQSTLFHDALEGRRVVICMRTAKYWGLGKRGRYGQSLFVPAVTRSGYLLKPGAADAPRDLIVACAKAAIARGPILDGGGR
jgi:hypothetical protein